MFEGINFEAIGPVLLLVAVVAVIGLALAVVIPALKRRGVNVSGALEAAGGVLNSADQITDVLKTIFPTSVIVNAADKIVDYAKVGAAKAEQLNKINEITRDERKEAAREFVYDALKLAGYEITPEIEKVADGAIEAAVLALGHGLDGAKYDALEGYGAGTEGAEAAAQVN